MDIIKQISDNLQRGEDEEVYNFTLEEHKALGQDFLEVWVAASSNAGSRASNIPRKLR